MTKKNRFIPIPNFPARIALETLVPNLTYRKLTVDQLPDEIKSNGLVTKFNSVVAAASGSLSGSIVFVLNGIRPDHGEIDEHPFVFHYGSSGSIEDFAGIIEHGNWSDRTTSLEPWQESAMSASGITADFTYKGIPPGASGSLFELESNGMLEGFNSQVKTLLKNKPKH